MSIQIFDSMSRANVPLEPGEPGRVRMYVCGPTVYNYIHIGNARTFLWFDLIRRYLTYRGFTVTYVMNYTDVDDKIIDRAKLEGVPPEEITAKYTLAFEEDMAALGLRPADILVRATDHVSDMVTAIEGLIAKNLAYASGGDVWFAVENFSGYGKLSNRTLDDMRAGERIEPHEGKRHPLDFALWKSAKEGEPSWDSPWGPGRPGWHIECSVMSTKYLGMGFDIHGGGSDLIFPHHENEIAQAEGLEEGTFARHWLHAGMVQMDSEKMSKSLGNVALAHDVVARYPGQVARYWAMTGSYRSQVTFSDGSLEDARLAYERLATFAESARHALGDDMPSGAGEQVRSYEDTQATGYIVRFISAMDDDFNSAEALAVLHELVRAGNKVLERVQRGDAEARQELVQHARDFLELTGVLGLSFETTQVSSELVGSLVEFLLELRDQAREEKAFDRADAIRDRLTDLGVSVEDTPAGPRWRV